MSARGLGSIRNEIEEIDAIDRRRMPQRWQEHIDHQRRSLVAEYFRTRCETGSLDCDRSRSEIASCNA